MTQPLPKACEPIQFVDLAAQQRLIRTELDEAIRRVLDHGAYVMGPEVTQLENELSAFCGAKYVLSCASGTDALALVLMAKQIKTGDAVFVPSFTFAATAEVVAWLGATPVFIDVLPDTFNMDPESLKLGIQAAKQAGLRPAAIIPVDLFGQAADYNALEPIAAENHLWILSDAAQSFGGTYQNRKVGTIGLATATSFFPSKPLACYGDGGAVFTDDADMYNVLKSIRVHGQGEDKYENVRIGMNGRLDTLQAVVLLEKLKLFSKEIKQRQAVADIYSQTLHDFVQTPFVQKGSQSAWAQYTVLLPDNIDRNVFANRLKAAGVPTAVYYPKPLHQQIAYQGFLKATPSLTVSEKLSQQVISLPMHPYLQRAQQDHILAQCIEALK